jgi:hypothetical protein
LAIAPSAAAWAAGANRAGGIGSLRLTRLLIDGAGHEIIEVCAAEGLLDLGFDGFFG